MNKYHKKSKPDLNKIDHISHSDTVSTRLQVNVWGFNLPQTSDRRLHVLNCSFTPSKAVHIHRCVVLFNRAGGNGSFELIGQEDGISLSTGEKFVFVVMHYRVDIGAFWGAPNHTTESRNLDARSSEERRVFMAQLLQDSSPYYCRMDITFTNGETATHDFSLLSYKRDIRPAVLDPAFMKPFDSNVQLPSRGTFSVG